uniref:C2H2-type domain-containing protein n=1 Tax=Elaeophora elaphi TaxID=1147741 RepID=A0A0R3RXI9_9BILA
MDCYSELWCLATVDGKECKESFDTYEDFEEHFCQKHLDLALFGCGARGCTAQFGTALQIFRHLETCKRRGKKIKLLQYSGSALESLTALDRAKLLAMQCSVQRAKRENELTTISGSVTTQRSEASNVQRLHIVDGMSFPSSLNDDQIHVSIIESPELCQVEDVGSEPYPVRRERIITPARQAAWRLKEQMLLEQEMKKKNKPPEKTGKDTQNKQKKLPVKITDKTRISALINDDPERKRTLGHPLTMESSLSRNSGFGTVNSNMFFESTKHILCTESRTKLRPTEIQHRSAIQKQPKAFESNLPAGPNNPPKIGDVSRPQSSSLDYIITRPPDYSGFLRNPATNPTLYDIPLPMFSPIQASCDRQNNFETNRTLTKTSLLSQPATFSTSEIAVQQKRSFMKLPGILRKARI